MNDIKILIGSTKEEIDKRANFYQMFAQSPIPEKEILSNLGLYLNRQTLSRILFMHELYLKIVNVHGVVVEFGVRYGQNLALFESFRGIYEPFNYNRKVIGFDTFSGFPEVSSNDSDTLSKGDYSVPDNYENYLEDVLKYHESEQPIPQKKKFELVKGDAVITIDDYLERHPETIIALAYFDFDLYSPTKKCLQAIKDRLTKGSILAFDELNCPEFPGETLAFKEVIGINSYSIKRSPLNPLCSYIVIE
jgi:SAM-dependent methyltransferase